jgi:FAD:protein FMN transferase
VECTEELDCFGGRCAVLVSGESVAAQHAVALARRRLLACHERFTRFDPGSELSRLNRDPRDVVPVSPVMASFARSAVGVAAVTGGLVDPTLLPELERAGYVGAAPPGLALPEALALAPPRRPARPSPDARWRAVQVDGAAGTIARPPGLELDSGGLKGFFADLVGASLAGHEAYALGCAGDVRVGGAGGRPRTVRVQSPFDDAITLDELPVVEGGVATSGIGRRSWRDAAGRPAHHLLDPSTGRPCFTGIVQATALAPTALHAEALAKAALLSGPGGAERWLRFGGVLVYEDGGHHRVAPTSVLQASYGSITPVPEAA